MAATRPDPALTPVGAAIIARASTDHQGDTCAHQVMALQTWAKHLSGRDTGERFLIQPQHIFIDDGVSAWKESILERPAVQRFIQAVERGEVQCLFIKGLSRFNRDDAEAKMFFEWLDGKGVRVKSLEEGFDSRERGGAMAIFHVHSFLARLESDKKSIATKIGMREKMKKGEWKGGIPPYGFRYVPARKRLEPRDELRPVIRDIFALAAAGRGPAWIAHHYNQSRKWAHVDPRIWTATTIQRLLTRRAYVGDLVCGVHNYRYTRTLERSRSGSYLFGKKRRVLERAPASDIIVVPDAHEGIVPRALFQRVQAQLQRRRRGPQQRPGPSPNARYPLTGLLICGHCGGPMIHHGRQAARGYRYYTCANKFRKGKSVCDQENVRSDHLHELVLLLLAAKLAALRDDAGFWARWQVTAPPAQGAARRLAELDAQIEQAANNLAQYLVTAPGPGDAVRGLVAARAEQELQRLHQERARLQHELQAAAAACPDARQLQRDIDDLFRQGLACSPDSSTAELRDLCHQWVERITLHNAASSGRHRGRHRKKAVTIEWRVDLAPRGSG